VPVAILFPRYSHPAIEESYASRQAEMLLRDGAAEFRLYDDDEPAARVVKQVEASHALVVTDPLLLPSPALADHLVQVLESTGAFAVVPVTNEPAHGAQRAAIATYVTLRELELELDNLRRREPGSDRVQWDDSNPGAFLCATSSLASLEQPLRNALAGRDVAVSRGDFIHRWASHRGQMRDDLLERIPLDAKSILEFGCGEGALAAALKRRQKCRVVGIELDKDAAAKARERMDDVYCGDAREIVAIIHERFDWIVGGDIIEHLDEPWSFLADMRRVSADGGRLLLSLPNVASASVIADLLQGRFDYVYMGLTCVGHLRFFTRRSIEDLLAIAGWSVESIEAQAQIATTQRDQLIRGLEAASIPFSKEDLLAPGYYVIARNVLHD
jgi:SAM-dependent methyltransferase